MHFREAKFRMTSVSKNPFELLDEDGEGGLNAPLATPAAAPAAGGKKDAPKAAAGGDAPKVGGKAAASGGRGGGGGGRGGKREFDRHSGTGRGRASDGAEDKRGGSGKYNWGSKADGTTPEDEAQDAKEMTEEEKEAAAAAEAEVDITTGPQSSAIPLPPLGNLRCT